MAKRPTSNPLAPSLDTSNEPIVSTAPSSPVEAPEATEATPVAQEAPKAVLEAPEAPVSPTVLKGVPMPGNARGRVAGYPWDAMDIGDMFFVPNGKINSFYSLCSSTSKAKGKTFVARKFTNGGVDGIGVWRLK